MIVVNIDQIDDDNMEMDTLQDIDPVDTLVKDAKIVVENMDEEDDNTREKKTMHNVDTTAPEIERVQRGGDEEEPVILAAPCDERCKLPLDWGSILHTKLETLDENLSLHELLVAIVSLEYCDHCNIIKYPKCNLEDDCEDLIKFL